MNQATTGIGNSSSNEALVQMAMGYFRSRALCAAARLGVADALGDAERSIEDLAAACQADRDALYRLLRAVASFGVVAETEPERFRLTSLGQPLRKDAPQSAWPAVVFWSDLLADDWSLLTECVRTGKPARDVRDPNMPTRWASVDPDYSIFRAVMGTAPTEEYMPLARAMDLSQCRVVADLGGGGGALLVAMLESNARLRGMLVDRAESIARAELRFKALSLRCELITADLTQSVPPGADVHVLKHVLHGYRDQPAIALLRNCRAVLPPSGKLIIAEFVLPPIVSHADSSLEGRLMSDLNMLAVTGGKERSEREWKALLDAAGFSLRRVIPLRGDTFMVHNVALIEANPA